MVLHDNYETILISLGFLGKHRHLLRFCLVALHTSPIITIKDVFGVRTYYHDID